MMVERLKRRADFLLVAGSRRKYVTPGFVLQARARDAAAPVPRDAVRVGFTATRKLGGAVVRNRARRRLRGGQRRQRQEPRCTTEGDTGERRQFHAIHVRNRK